MRVCEVCGLPEDLCICEDIARETQKIKVYVAKRKFGKNVTIIEGIDSKTINLNELVKKLKTELACGGTVKNNKIELQGDQRQKVKKLLVKQGFSEDLIEVT